MEENLFKYNEKFETYVAIIDGVEVNNDKEPTQEDIEYAKKVAKAYNEKKSEIVELIKNDEDFVRFYNITDFSEKDILEKLGEPKIRIMKAKYGEVTYCNQTFDQEHIISFEFMGVFEKMAGLAIDG